MKYAYNWDPRTCAGCHRLVISTVREPRHYEKKKDHTECRKIYTETLSANPEPIRQSNTLVSWAMVDMLSTGGVT